MRLEQPRAPHIYSAQAVGAACHGSVRESRGDLHDGFPDKLHTAARGIFLLHPIYPLAPARCRQKIAKSRRAGQAGGPRRFGSGESSRGKRSEAGTSARAGRLTFA